MTNEGNKNWLERSLRNASAEVATWPEWMKKAMRVSDPPLLEGKGLTYVVVADRSHSEEEWLRERQTRVTASESAHLMGLVKGSWALSEEQLAEKKRSNEAEPATARMSAGTWWEGPIIRYVGDVLGLSTIPSSALYASVEHPFMGATPDAQVCDLVEPDYGLSDWLTVVHDFEVRRGADAVEYVRDLLLMGDGKALLEVKNQESKRRPMWNKEAGAPPHYENQVRHQLAVLDDYSVGLLAAKVDANELYVHIIERDSSYEELLIDTCRAFSEKYLTGA